MLRIKKLKKYFGGVKAVNNCSFEIKKKTITALIGPNGSGKTTVFNLISGILKPDSGKIIFNKKDIAGKAPETVSNLGISRVFQQPRLFNNLTVEENLLLALNTKDAKFFKNLLGLDGISKNVEEKIEEMLKEINLEEFKNKLAGDLSFGQKRLIELVRAILNHHKFLMLDEPVGGVNPFLRKKISEILLRLKKQNETILLIEHDMNFAFGIADKVIVMEKGRVIAEGKPGEIKNNSEVLDAYLG